MDFDEIEHLRSEHAAWALLRPQNVGLVLGFLGGVFIDANASGLPASRLISELDDELFALNQRLGDERFPRRARDYLDEWAAPERGWLRRYYPPGTDEPHYDLTPAVEKAFAWVTDLRSRSFIGTESRLNMIFELLRQMVYGAATDPLRHGLAELVAYLSLREPGLEVVFDDDGRAVVSWPANDGEDGEHGDGGEVERVADTPRVTFARTEASPT